MKEIDLELYRWQWYITRIKDIKANRKNHLGMRLFWAECGAFISTLPRQSGKSTILIKMAEILNNKKEKFIIVVPREYMKKHLIDIASNINPMYIRSNPGAMISFYPQSMDDRPENTHLLIDEYSYIHKQALGRIMSEDWKSVSMIGTLKVEMI